MKYYKSADGGVFAFEADGSQDDFIRADLVRMTSAEEAAHCDKTPTPAQEYEAWKIERAKSVAAITVMTSNGRVFDGDEVSQGRMARAILSMQANPNITHTPWMMSNNEPANVTKEELAEALALAGIRQTQLWIKR